MGSFQVQDSKGYIIPGIGHGSDSQYIEGNATTTIFSGKGALLRIIITKDVDSGTFSVTDTDDTEYFAGVTDYAGSFNVGEYYTNGCKIVTANFGGGQMRVVCMPL